MATAQSAVQFSEEQRLRVQAHLEELLSTPAFSGSRRRQAFLRYVVEETLAGRGHAIKETNIAVDVFGRNSDFDAQSASIVRVTGGEVRKRLAQAYASELKHTLQIDLPVGSYHPTIHFLPETPADPEPVRAATIAVPKRRIHRAIWAMASIAALVTIAFAIGPPRDNQPLDRLWAPFIGQDQPVLMSLVAPTLLAIPEPDKWLPMRPGTSIPTDSLLAMEASYVGTGAALGGVLFAQRLTVHGQPFTLKFGNDLSFADFKNSPTIVIGASRWGREMTQSMRFQLLPAGASHIITIRDAKNPGKVWSMRIDHRMERNEGYSLITRLIHSESGRPVLLVEGMDARNTQAAVEFLTKDAVFEQFAKAAPGWEEKNFQVVLHNTIHGNSPGAISIIATQLW